MKIILHIDNLFQTLAVTPDALSLDTAFAGAYIRRARGRCTFAGRLTIMPPITYFAEGKSLSGNDMFLSSQCT
ncbi:MAG: hypothetical protein F4Z69_01835 [Bacteroidetes bacterium SB0668_bin_1]|nr:hypothetical protein [Bacteroidetes bacterium SB0668_bin_1]